ncbi:hypothetical protein C8Q79DRAFT_1014306 [Trametes meyenii]|nr:hypothetical protein C8Q79DRAFT_1014306 [Trametes meyenii]
MTSPAQTTSGNTLLRVDASSPRLQYSGQWTRVGSSQDCGGTSHTSSSTGSWVKFLFNGTFVAVYGSVNQTGSSSSYKLDDADPVTVNVEQPSPQHNWPFFPSPPLQQGLHELIITVNGGVFDLDYIEYTSVSGEEQPADASQVPTSAACLSSSPSPSLSPDSDSSSSTPHPKGLPGGYIAGIVVAAAMVVLLVSLALFYVHRRSARRVRHQVRQLEKGKNAVLFDDAPRGPEPAARGPFAGRFSRIYRPTPARSAQSSKTATSSAPTSVTQSSAMFTSVIVLSPALSMVSEESSQHEVTYRGTS